MMSKEVEGSVLGKVLKELDDKEARETILFNYLGIRRL